MHKFKVVCATQLAGPSGMQLWGVSQDGRLFTTLQKQQNAPWEAWSPCAGAPSDIIALAAAPNPAGYMSLWALTQDHVLHCQSQLPNGQWAWSDRDYPKGWWNAPKLTCMCVGVMGWSQRGRCFWGVGEDGKLWVTYEAIDDPLKNPLGGWTGWYQWDVPPGGSRIIALTTAVNGNGAMSLWALTADHVLHCKSQRTAEDAWPDPWVAHWWNAPKLVGICASMQGGSLGRAIWGIDEDKQLRWTYEQAVGGGGWKDGWSPFDAAGEPPRDIGSLCAARQYDARVALWALSSQDNSLHNTAQKTAGGDWFQWDAGGTRWSPPSMLDEIVAVIGKTGAKYRGVTYHGSSDNTFTLLDTPQLWDKGATAPKPIPACENLMKQIADTIGQGRIIVDITMMWELGRGLPSGHFQKALNQGIRTLVANNNNLSPLVRIMIGIPIPATVIPPDLHSWIVNVIQRDNGPKRNQVKFPILIGACQQKVISWNHSKIVAADGVRAVVGGHNLWSDHYLGANPVHDVSGLIEGSVVGAAHRFCDQLWTKPALTSGAWLLSNGTFTQYTGGLSRKPMARTPGKGSTRMLALARLGAGIVKDFTVATNASVSARIIALCRAKSMIRISQQSLYNSVMGATTGFDFYTLWAIIKAVQAGVKVQIVITNDVPLKDGGYEAFLTKVLDSLASLQIADRLGLKQYPPAVSPTREDIAAWASASLKPPTADIPLTVSRLPTPTESAPHLKQLNDNLQLAQLYYAAPNVNYWQVGALKKPAANHAKVYIIDDTHFYMGSDNMYLSAWAPGLQEYGYLIEGQTETQAFIKNYWDPLWKNSQSHIVQASFPKFAKMPAPVASS
jgi:phosphatidylserine/phosphatidylglycerophosphate/cardiolipin synthase-like enzyme